MIDTGTPSQPLPDQGVKTYENIFRSERVFEGVYRVRVRVFVRRTTETREGRCRLRVFRLTWFLFPRVSKRRKVMNVKGDEAC